MNIVVGLGSAIIGWSVTELLTLDRMLVDQPPKRIQTFALAATWAYPFALIASVYATWLIAWSTLGHAPRPSLDDPKLISAWVSISYNLVVILIIGFPIAGLGGVAATAWFGVSRKYSSWLVVLGIALLICLWIATLSLLRCDPLQVSNWFID